MIVPITFTVISENHAVIGFDTNHFGDGQHPDAPYGNPFRFTGHIWNWDEVEEETRRLADQVKEADHA